MSIEFHPMVYVIIWILISVAMILFNKAVLDSFDFPYPMFLTTCHMLTATIITQYMSMHTKLLTAVNEGKVDRKIIMSQFIPVALCFAISLVFGNKAYIYLSVSFIQMLKAGTPVIVLVLSTIFGLESPTLTELFIVFMIAAGVSITSVGELRFSWPGFIFQVSGILAESTRLVLTNSIMKKLKLDPLSSLYYIAPLSMIFILPACLVFEYNDLPFNRLTESTLVTMLSLSCVLAFALNVSVVYLIANTSALVLTLAGVIKDVFLVVLSVIVFRSPVSTTQIVGYGIALFGLNLHKEYKKDPEKVYKTFSDYFFCCVQRSSSILPKNSQQPHQIRIEKSEPLKEEEEGLLNITSGNSDAK